jgi:integrase/recombinase XerC
MKKKEKEIINEYLDDCRKRLALNTVENYKSILSSLKGFLGDVNILYASKIDIRRYLNDLTCRGLARSTIGGRISALNSFYKYVRTFHGLDTITLDEFDIHDYTRSKWEGSGTEPLSKIEVRLIIDAAKSIRDTLIISILYYCGLRANEITLITLDDIDVEKRELMILGKGNKPRIVPYSSSLDRIIRLWIHKERISYVHQNGPYLFPSKHGEQLTTSAIYRLVIKAAEDSGVQKIVGERGDGTKIYKVHPHIFRHSYAAHAVKDGIPLIYLQQYMGHNRINTTLAYTGMGGLFEIYQQQFKGV